jgi:hypothetical protein
VATAILACGGLAAILAARPAWAQVATQAVDFAGQWQSRNHEDLLERGPGPLLGDYAGFPINAAARQKAETWDPAVLSQLERQTQPHPAAYFMRGPRPDIRISEVRDPVSEQLIALTIVGMYGRADRTIWLDGRPHPSEHAEHTWAGFSTGTFHGGELTVVTTHMKMGVIQRIGVPSSPYAVMTEHFFRHGTLLQMTTIITDPIYLEEPMVRSQTWVLNPAQVIYPAPAFEAVDEVAGKETGWVPHYPLGATQTEFAERTGLPFEATLGGKASMYPEFQLTLAELMAAKAAAQKRQPEK